MENKIHKPFSYSTLTKLELRDDIDFKEAIKSKGIYNIDNFYKRYFKTEEQELTLPLYKGSLLDDLILTPENLNNYKFVNFETPESVNHFKFCELVLKQIQDAGDDFDINDLTDNQKDEVLSKVFKRYSTDKYNELIHRYRGYIRTRYSSPDKYVLNQKYSDIVRKQRDAVMANEEAVRLLTTKGVNQLSLTNSKDNIRGTLDRLVIEGDKNEKLTIVDIKTTGNIDTFHESFYKYGYYIQQALYKHLVETSSEAIREAAEIDTVSTIFPEFRFIVVSSYPPYECVVTEFDDIPDVGEYGGVIALGSNSDRKLKEFYLVRGWRELIKYVKKCESVDWQDYNTVKGIKEYNITMMG